MAMRYTMKLLTAPHGGKVLSQHIYLKNGAEYGKKVIDKLVQHHRFATRKYLVHKIDVNEKHKMHIFVAHPIIVT